MSNKKQYKLLLSTMYKAVMLKLILKHQKIQTKIPQKKIRLSSQSEEFQTKIP